MRKTSVLETGTTKLSEPPSSWRYLVCSLLKKQIPTQQMALTLEMLEEKYWQETHIYTAPTAQCKMLLEMEAVACLSRPQQDKQLATHYTAGRKCSNFKAKTSALQTAVAYTHTTTRSTSVEPHGSLSPANPVIHRCRQAVPGDPGAVHQQIDKCASRSPNAPFAMLRFPYNQNR